MPHYISLARYTQKGVENVKDAPKRIDAAKKSIEAAGGTLKGVYWTFGRYDAVIVAEFPDDEAGMKALLAAAMQGYVRGETLRAFTEPEIRKIVASLQ